MSNMRRVYIVQGIGVSYKREGGCSCYCMLWQSLLLVLAYVSNTEACSGGQYPEPLKYQLYAGDENGIVLKLDNALTTFTPYLNFGLNYVTDMYGRKDNTILYVLAGGAIYKVDLSTANINTAQGPNKLSMNYNAAPVGEIFQINAYLDETYLYYLTSVNPRIWYYYILSNGNSFEVFRLSDISLKYSDMVVLPDGTGLLILDHGAIVKTGKQGQFPANVFGNSNYNSGGCSAGNDIGTGINALVGQLYNMVLSNSGTFLIVFDYDCLSIYKIMLPAFSGTRIATFSSDTYRITSLAMTSDDAYVLFTFSISGSAMRVLNIATGEITTRDYSYNGYNNGAHALFSVNSPTSCMACTSGDYCPANAAARATCSAGSYCPTTAISIGCPSRTYSAAVGATSPSVCALCAVGTQSASVGANSSSVCLTCAAGLYAAPPVNISYIFDQVTSSILKYDLISRNYSTFCKNTGTANYCAVYGYGRMDWYVTFSGDYLYSADGVSVNRVDLTTAYTTTIPVPASLPYRVMLNLDESVLYAFSRSNFNWVSYRFSDATTQTVYTQPIQDQAYTDIVFLNDQVSMLIADHHAVLQMNMATLSSSLVAGSVSTSGNLAGVGTAARFTDIYKMVINNAGTYVLIADAISLFKMMLSTYTVTVVLPTTITSILSVALAPDDSYALLIISGSTRYKFFRMDMQSLVMTQELSEVNPQDVVTRTLRQCTPCVSGMPMVQSSRAFYIDSPTGNFVMFASSSQTKTVICTACIASAARTKLHCLKTGTYCYVAVGAGSTVAIVNTQTASISYPPNNKWTVAAPNREETMLYLYNSAQSWWYRYSLSDSTLVQLVQTTALWPSAIVFKADKVTALVSSGWWIFEMNTNTLATTPVMGTQAGIGSYTCASGSGLMPMFYSIYLMKISDSGNTLLIFDEGCGVIFKVNVATYAAVRIFNVPSTNSVGFLDFSQDEMYAVFSMYNNFNNPQPSDNLVQMLNLDTLEVSTFLASGQPLYSQAMTINTLKQCGTCSAGYYCPRNYGFKCPAGYYCPTTSSKLLCGVGYICAEGSTAQAVCPVGSYCPDSLTKITCDAGHLCPVGSSSQSACPAGSYCPDALTMLNCSIGYICVENSTSAVLCPAGNYCPNTTAQITCLVGTYCPPGTTQATCPEGSYCPDTLTKLNCGAGYLCPSGSTSAVICPAGSYCPSFTSKVSCNLTYYCPAGSTNSAYCPMGNYCPTPYTLIPCSAGSYCVAGSITQAYCSAGSYCPDPATIFACALPNYCPAGSISQTLCPAGSYCNSTASSIQCAVGSTCPAGSTSQAACPAGYYCSVPAQILVCATGAYCPPASSAPSQCAVGFVCSTTSSQIPCNASWYCPIGSTAQSKCVAGFYCPNASAQVPCPSNTYCLAGSVAPTPCPAGAICSSMNQTSCSPGDYCPPGSTAQSKCMAGFYCPNASTQIPCPSNMYCLVGSVAPTPCPAGAICSSMNQTSCGPGDYCPPGSTSQTKCSQGFYCPNASTQLTCVSSYYCPQGSISPVLCASGNYCPNASAQIQCTVSNYCPVGSTSSTQCAAGFVCSTTSSQIPCNASWYCPMGSTAQTKCSQGFYCPNASTQLTCVSSYYCPQGSVSPVLCASGNYCPNASAQIQCTVSNYCPLGSTSSTQCAAGFMCPNTTAQLPCSPPSYCPKGSTSANPCAPGSFCPNTTSQLQCANNTYCPVGSTAPTSCPSLSSSAAGSNALTQCVCGAGMYLSGIPQCVSCPANSFCSNNTITPCPLGTDGAAGATNYLQCRCKKGTFGSILSPTNTTCTPCLKGQFCPADQSAVACGC